MCVVLDKVRSALEKRGTKTIRGMGRVFRIMEDGGNRVLDKQEFYWGIKDLGVTLTMKEAEALIECLDTNRDGFVNYDEFLVGIRGRPNAFRQAVIDRAFVKFDVSCDGAITCHDLEPVFDCRFHPKVASGECTSQEVFTDFLASFGDKNGDGQITRNEWNDYYAAVSASVDNDEMFNSLMIAAWKLPADDK
jgi:Ca2+-binding EF-hand superfamily protein